MCVDMCVDMHVDMCVDMCVDIHVCRHVCRYACRHVRVQMRAWCAHVRADMRVDVCVRACARAHVHMHARARLCASACVHVSACVVRVDTGVKYHFCTYEVGIGLFPLGGLVNHSCEPTVAASVKVTRAEPSLPASVTLSMRAVRRLTSNSAVCALSDIGLK